jgi:pyridoxal-phosphate dependent enzyme
VKAPIVSEHQAVTVVRDDLYPGGTKARIFAPLFGRYAEIVYASPAQGGAQTALAHAAAATGKRATVFVAKRDIPHPRAIEAKRMGATVLQVRPGYLTVVQARARAYCAATGAFLLPFGADIPEAPDIVAQAARALAIEPDEVWCAAGSGVLMRGLARAWPHAKRHAVQIGRTLSEREVAGATIHVYPRPYDYALHDAAPFPADPHYDAKAWQVCARLHGPGTVLFWNVTGPAQPS